METTGVTVYDINSLQGPLANAFLLLINALFFNIQIITKKDDYPQDKIDIVLNQGNPVFDFVIVGAGASGCVLANRLSEENEFTVLLIEAGDYPPASSVVPSFFPTFLTSPMDTWKYSLEMDKKACQGHIDNKCWITRGKILGGTSTINNLHYFRGLESELQSFSNYTKDFFDSLEHTYERPNSLVRGEIFLSQINESDTKILNILKTGYRELGFSEKNEHSILGYSEHLLTIKDGQRLNMAKAFLHPVKNRSNFFLIKNAIVEGVVITEPVDKRAKGVNVTINNKIVFIQARKEVILTAGAINNAKLLLLSGVGPTEYLENKKITPVVNTPGVGKNLKMHVSIPVFVGLESFCDACQNDIYDETDLINDVFNFVIHKSGNLTNTGVNSFVNYISIHENSNVPSVGIYHVYFQISDRMLESWLHGFEIQQKIINNIKKINSQRAILMFLPTLLKPKSSGEILLNHTHHESNPYVYGNFFTDKDNQDITSLVKAVSYISNLTETKAMKNLSAEILNIGVPSCNNLKFCSLHYVKCYIKNMVTPTSDISGTIKRGPECDKDSVVKPDMEVKYVRCLRVADSSVLSDITTGNTVPIDAMLGLKMSEILKTKWIKNYESSLRN